MRNPMDNVVLGWRNKEAEAANLGDGISRPKPGQMTRMYRVLVRFESAQPMKAVLRAPSKRDVIKYARNRWPGACCEVLGLVDVA